MIGQRKLTEIRQNGLFNPKGYRSFKPFTDDAFLSNFDGPNFIPVKTCWRRVGQNPILERREWSSTGLMDMGALVMIEFGLK